MKTRAFIVTSLVMLAVPRLPAADFTSTNSSAANNSGSLLAAANLANLSPEQLWNTKVTILGSAQTVSKTPAAVSVVTADDIKRSGARNIPEALRLVPGVDAAQIDSSQWAVSVRGFNDEFANKLLVLEDGRSIYTPLFGGVFWDVQDTMMADIDHIEVVRGPGATFWGANAMNGVINIITKNSADTQGWLVQGGAGTLERGFGSARYGGTIADGVHYRVYGSYGDHGNTTLLSDAEATNDWQMARGGFRVDVDRDPDNVFMFEGDGYAGWERQNFFGIYTNTLPPASLAVSQDSLLEGADAVAHWTHTFSDTSSFKLQADYDYTGRKAAIFDEQRHTGDINAQQQFALGNHNTIEAGLGYRVTADSEKNNPSVSFIPESQTVNLYSGFVQDEIALVPDKLTLTPGTKVEHNDYTGFEFEPGGRLAWTPTDKQTFWASVSRAVRTPTRVEETVASTASKTIFVPFPVVIPVHVYGMNDFGSETLMAYELGYRVEPVNKLSLDFAAFYNDYGDLRSAQLTPSGSIILGNDLHGHTYGIEASGDWRVMDWWRLRPSYTFLKMKLFASPDGTGYSDAASVAQLEGTSPQNQFSMASEMDFPHGWTFDAELRYVDSLTWDSPSDGFPVSSYIEMNARLAWQMNKHFEAAIVGENLLHDEHSEFGATEVNVQPTEIPRSIYGEISCRF